MSGFGRLSPGDHPGFWRDIPGYDGMYQISRDGEVRSWKGKKGHIAPGPHILTQFRRHGRAVRFVKLTDSKGKTADRPVLGLMVNAWLGGPRPGMVAYHANGDLSDHCISNIRFATRKELGRMTGADAGRIPVAKVTPQGEIADIYPSAREAAKANHMSYQAILNRCHGKVKKPFALDGYNYVFDR